MYFLRDNSFSAGMLEVSRGAALYYPCRKKEYSVMRSDWPDLPSMDGFELVSDTRHRIYLLDPVAEVSNGQITDMAATSKVLVESGYSYLS